MDGRALVDLLKEHIGEVYRLGALVPKNNAEWTGPWDCAETASWGIYQMCGKLYGCMDNDGKPETADAWTNWFKRDVQAGKLHVITIDEAKRTPGAFVLRFTEGSRIGHIACTQGDAAGRTVEAKSAKAGFCEDWVDGRRWDTAFVVPEMVYTTLEAEAEGGVDKVAGAYVGPAARVFRLTSPMMVDPMIGLIQERLKLLGLYTKGIDNKYGEGTFKGVCEAQKSLGLVVDGEVMVGGETWKQLGVES